MRGQKKNKKGKGNIQASRKQSKKERSRARKKEAEQGRRKLSK